MHIPEIQTDRLCSDILHHSMLVRDFKCVQSMKMKQQGKRYARGPCPIGQSMKIAPGTWLGLVAERLPKLWLAAALRCKN
jgi:hypothetical protein